MKTRITLMAIIGLFLSLSVNAQETVSFSLQEAIQYGLENNANVKNANTDVEIARKKIHETMAIGLPQVNAKLSNTNYLDIATLLIPNFENLSDPDDKVEVQFGTQYNATAEVSVSQLIFNGSYIVGLQAARAYLEQSKVQSEKSKLDTKELITSAYYLVLVTKANESILETTLQNLKNTFNETKEIHKQGFIEDTEVDQLELMIADLETNLLYVNNQIVLAESQLKVLLGIDFSNNIELTDNLEELLDDIKTPTLLLSDFQFSKNIDYRIMQNQKELSALTLKNEKAKALPVLSAAFSAQANAMRDSYNFFTSNEPWYKTTLWSLQMDIPIFSSGSRSSKTKQAKLELKKIEELEYQLQNNLSTEEINTKTKFKNSLLILQNKVNSVKLSQKIYTKTQVKYKEGVSSSTDLLQVHNQYLEAEGNYIASILDLVNAKLALEKLFAE